MQLTEQRFGFCLKWEEPSKEMTPGNEKWSVEVSADHPQLVKKLGGRPRRFTASTRDGALAEARGFIDSLSMF